MKTILATLFATVLALFTFTAATADAGGGAPAPVTVSADFGNDAPQYDGDLAAIRVGYRQDSLFEMTLWYLGPELGEPYSVWWDRDVAVTCFAGATPLAWHDIFFSGSATGSWWSPNDDDGFEFTFGIGNTFTQTITDPAVLALFEGTGSVDLDWSVLVSGSQGVTVGQTGPTGYFYDALSYTVDIEYIPVGARRRR